MIFFYVLILAAGFFALVRGADVFVSGSASAARRFRVPGVIIGLTVVALGTSAPELAVSISAAIAGSNELALSNVVGSNIFNLLAVLGICAMISPLPVERAVLRRDLPVSAFGTAGVLALAGAAMLRMGGRGAVSMEDTVGTIGRGAGLAMTAVFALYIVFLIHSARNSAEEGAPAGGMPLAKSLPFIGSGLAMIVAGGRAVVFSAREIAAFLGMSETLIGMTVVAAGTSLPELVTSIVAARKGETGLAIGNVVGSNIFNIVFILGVSASLHPITVSLASVTDLVLLLAANLLAAVFCSSGGRIGRGEGAAMFALYISDMVFAIVR